MIRAIARWTSMAAKPRFISVAGETTSCCSPSFRRKRHRPAPKNRRRAGGRAGKRGQPKGGGKGCTHNRHGSSSKSLLAIGPINFRSLTMIMAIVVFLLCYRPLNQSAQGRYFNHRQADPKGDMLSFPAVEALR